MVNKDIVVPVNDDHSWLRDFYTMLMDNNMKNEMYLMIELMIKENPYKGGTFRNLSVADPETIIQEYKPIAATMVKWNNFDGTIRYGSYELPFFEIPLNREDPKKNKELPYISKITIGQPVNLPENIPSDLFDGRKHPESLFRKPDGFEDNTNFPKRNPNANNPDPFIANEKNQVVSELFKKDDIWILYVDGARFLPENVSFNRVVVTWYTSSGNEVIRNITWPANLNKSTGQMPFYGLREEIEHRYNPNLDPTMIGVFRIETFDRSNGEQRVVGYSFFPFFLDKNAKSSVTNPKDKKYWLHNGSYQLPMFSQHPDLTTPIKIDNLLNVEKLPCSSLLIRIEKAPRDADNKPMRYKELNESKRYEYGVVSVPPKYSQGLYNTMYWQIGLTEAEILKEKVMRPDPSMMKVAAATKDILFNKTKMTVPEMSVWLGGVFNDYKAAKDSLMLNYNFFSQYIPRLGLRFALEMMFNTEAENLYVALVSIHPPGSLYQKHPKFEKAVMFTDVDYNSPWTAQKFNEILYSFKNMPSNHRSVFIIDIKSISFQNKGVARVDDYGWTAFPMFEDLETDDDPDTLELYVNSGVYMMPIFDGPVVSDFINTMIQKDKPYKYIMDQVDSEIPPVRIKGNAGVIIKWVDNQREGHFKEAVEDQKVSLRYVPKDMEAEYAFDQKAINGLKRSLKVSKLVPKGKKIKDMNEELENLIKANYNFEY